MHGPTSLWALQESQLIEGATEARRGGRWCRSASVCQEFCPTAQVKLSMRIGPVSSSSTMHSKTTAQHWVWHLGNTASHFHCNFLDPSPLEMAVLYSPLVHLQFHQVERLLLYFRQLLLSGRHADSLVLHSVKLRRCRVSLPSCLYLVCCRATRFHRLSRLRPYHWRWHALAQTFGKNLGQSDTRDMMATVAHFR